MALILVIDDEPMVRRTVRLILQSAGHEVVEASNGREGEECFERRPTDLVITDILMPEQEGVETIINLRGRHPSVKLLAMSGGGRTGNQDFLDMAKGFGAIDVLKKPFTPVQLIALVEQICGRAVAA